MNNDNNQAIIRAIKNAEASLRLAHRLLGGSTTAAPAAEGKDLGSLSSIEGTFDGSHMVSADGKKYRVNDNYATKSMLVYGDKLRAYDENGKYWFKQVDKVKREKVSGVLTQKAAVWHVVTGDGSYKVSPEAVDFLNLKVNDEVAVFLPANNKRVPFATLDFVKKVREEKKAVVAEEKVEEKAVVAEEKKAPEPKKAVVSKPRSRPAAEPKKTVKKPLEKTEVSEKVVLEEDDLR